MYREILGCMGKCVRIVGEIVVLFLNLCTMELRFSAGSSRNSKLHPLLKGL